MTSNTYASRPLPEKPSREYLRKEAKRLAKQASVPLAKAQRTLANEYGFATWPALIAHVQALEPAQVLSPLAQAARAGDVETVRQLLSDGHNPDDGGADSSPLWEACSSSAPDAQRLAIAAALLEAGASARKAVPGQRPLHAAAARGPVALAEILIRHGAIEWEPNAKGRSALAIARRARFAGVKQMIELLDRPVISDRGFRAAVDALHAGDAARLSQLLDAEPRLLSDRILERDCYRASGRDQYFLDPKLFWFIANNPTLIETMPANMPELARVMIARGVTKADLDYALGLVMTSAKAREADLQIPLVEVLVEAGASARADDMGGVLGHGETEVVRYLVSSGMPMTSPIAAALGVADELPALLAAASQQERDEALDLAVINNRTDAARMALAAGANPDRFSSQHSHSQPLHQAALHDNVELVALLLDHGARLDAVDTLWGGTPIGWAYHGANRQVIDYLEQIQKRAGD
jgi:ankyrin repeat protein